MTSRKPTDHLDPSQLLQPMPLHHVIVCTDCRYAVPPSTLSRHLKEIHQISRAQRGMFLDYASQFTLKQPREVVLPQQNQFPVPILPVVDGLRCGSPNCNHLCVTEKRMRNHWVSVHRRAGQPDLDWHYAPIQTFFRGKNLRYFTCTDSPSDTMAEDELPGKLVPPSVIAIRSTQGPSAGNMVYDVTDTLGPATEQQTFMSALEERKAQLLGYYESSTSKTLANGDAMRTLWRETVVCLATNHQFLMHGILAITALHMAYHEVDPHRRKHNFLLASDYQDKAMPAFRHAVANVDRLNCDAILAFTHLLVIYSFASEKQEEEMLLTTESALDVIPAWLHFIRNGCSMLCSQWEALETGPCRVLTLAWDSMELPQFKSESPPDILSHFLRVIPVGYEDSWSELECIEYRKAASELAQAFIYSRESTQPCTTWEIIRIWPLEMSDKFIAMLGMCHPGSLILLSHYALLLKDIEDYWYFQGRASRLIRTITRKLDIKWRKFIEVPLQSIDLSTDKVTGSSTRSDYEEIS